MSKRIIVYLSFSIILVLTSLLTVAALARIILPVTSSSTGTVAYAGNNYISPTFSAQNNLPLMEGHTFTIAHNQYTGNTID